MSKKFLSRLVRQSTFLTSLLLIGISSPQAASLNINIKDGSGNLLPGATVYAVQFGNQGPNGSISIMANDAEDGTLDGVVQVNGLTTNQPYEFFASLQNHGPTVRSQMFNPEHPHVYMDAAADGTTTTIFLKDPIYTDRGTITANVTKASLPNRMLFGNVRKISTGKDVAFAACVTAAVSSACAMVFENIAAPTATNIYDVSVFDPSGNNGQGNGNGGQMAATLAVGGNAAIAIDMTGGLPPDLSANEGGTQINQGPQQGGQGSLVLEGVVEDINYSTMTVPWGGLSLRVEDQNGNKFDRMGSGVDQNGRFQIYGSLDIGTTYYVRSFGGCRNDGICYDGYESTHTWNPATPDTLDSSGNDFLYASSASVKVLHIKLSRATPGIFTLAVNVQDNTGRNLPGAMVNLNGDGTPWHHSANPNIPYGGAAICAGGNHPVDISSQAFVNVNAQGTTGYVLVTALKPGNYMVQANSQFSSQGISFNAGPDGVFNWGNGGNNHRGCFDGSQDDLKLTIEENGKVNVYDTSGTIVMANVSSITVRVPVSKSSVGTVTGTLTFPEPVDLRSDPITIILRGACGQNGCSGNFDTIGDDEAPNQTSYTYTIQVATFQLAGGQGPDTEAATYYPEIISRYWGRVQDGGGQDQIIFKTNAPVTRDFKFAHAGQILGKLYKPDGSLFLPGPVTGGGWVSGNINARGITGHSWNHANVLQDGSFVIGGLTPGEYELDPNSWGGSVTYASPLPKARVTVFADRDSYKDVKFADGEVLSVIMPLTGLPHLTSILDGNNNVRGENWTGLRMPAGTSFTTENISKILTNSDESIFFKYNPPYVGSGQCGMNWPGGICPMQVPTGQTFDLYMTRFGDMEGGDYQYMTFINSKKNVVVDEAHRSGVPVNFNNTPVDPVEVTLTPGAVSPGARVEGLVTAVNIFRQSDFEALGGSFDNFIKFIPLVSFYDANGALKSVGLVTPPPDSISDGGDVGLAIDAAVAANDYSMFTQAVAGVSWRYAVNGLVPGQTYTLVGTTPNYPPVAKTITVGVAGSTQTVDINWDTEAGEGATLKGIVKSTAAATPEIADASVEIQARGLKSKILITDANGVYSVPGLASGKYKIKVTADGYAPSSEIQDVVGNSTFTLNFTLTMAPGDITGTVRELVLTSRGPVIKPVSGATILAYDDTFNAQNLTKPLALYKVQTSSEGIYDLIGVIPTHVYKIFAVSPGRYIETISTTATVGTVSGVDLNLKQKPLQVEVFTRPNPPNYEFSILNPNNFESGRVWYEDAAGGFDLATATEITNSFTSLPDGSLIGTVPLADLGATTVYTLHIVATPSSGEADVVREINFGKQVDGNTEQPVDDKIIGDDSTDESGHKNNELTLGSGGDNNAGLELPTGSLIQTSTAQVPTITLTQSSTESLSGGQSQFDGNFEGDVYTITFSSLQFTGREVVFNLGYNTDDVGGNISNLKVFHFNPSSDEWELVAGQITVDPVSGVVSVSADPNVLQGFQLPLGNNAPAGAPRISSSSRRSERQGMSASSNGKTFSVNASAASSGSGSFMVGFAASTGTVNASGTYKQYSFPNPFDLKQKTVTLINGTGGSVPTSIRGAYIVVAPVGTGTVNVTVRIYNVGGDMVREITNTAAAGIYNYIHWDGRNASGDDVASGVYFAKVEAPGAPKRDPIKMVVVK